MSEWCQNPRCAGKKNQNQIRGSKGNKWYQSNKANRYGNGNFCTQGCYDSWAGQYMNQAIDNLGVRITNPVKIYLEDAWYVTYVWGSYADDLPQYQLINKLKGVKHTITKQQAQTPEQQAEEYGSWETIDDTQAKELAIQLGLAS